MRSSVSLKGCCLVLCLIPFLAQSQTPEWWRNNVQWDGTSFWATYMITSPRYFGPNPFTVPAINNGSTDSISSLETGSRFFFNK